MKTVNADQAITALTQRWLAVWNDALACWGGFQRLRPPQFCTTAAEEKHEGLLESFAMIRLTDHRIVLSPRQILRKGLADFPREIMAHEAGHHVYCPADLSDAARLLARIRRNLPGQESASSMVSNLYTDLLINNRLKREQGLAMEAVYRALGGGPGSLWNLYQRIYELLWALPSGTLTTIAISDEMEGDARIGADLARSYAGRWIEGGGLFAALCLPWLGMDGGLTANDPMQSLADSLRPGDGSTLPEGLADMDTEDLQRHRLDEIDSKPSSDRRQQTDGGGSRIEPYEYGQILRALGVRVDEKSITARYYRERAIPHLIPFPKRPVPSLTEEIPEGVDVWDAGSPLERISWPQSLMRSPVVIPGVTTVEQRYGEMPGTERTPEPIDLDLYVDSSGSMPNPGVEMSYLTLAGTIIALSALRAGARVQATLWSGPGEVMTTKGFTRSSDAIMAVLTGYFGGCTAFPLPVLRDTYAGRDPAARRVHILHISDDGITSIFEKDERGTDGREIAGAALALAGGGGTMALNIHSWENNQELVFAHAQGWAIYPVRDWSELVRFAREFARRHYHRELRR